MNRNSIIFSAIFLFSLGVVGALENPYHTEGGPDPRDTRAETPTPLPPECFTGGMKRLVRCILK